jgi:hypothetical protein
MYESCLRPVILRKRRIREIVAALGTHEEQDHTSLLPLRLVLVENGARGAEKNH